jgi:hypothetical protein
MVFKRKYTPPTMSIESRDPVPIGEVIEELFDTEKRTIDVDPAAEHERKIFVTEKLRDAVSAVREEEMEKAQAGEDYDPEVFNVLGQVLLELTVKSQELQQQPPQTSVNPRP